MNNKSIDINQRIPLATLHAALESHLNGHYSSDYALEQLKLEFKGENRLKKAVRIVDKIILRSPLNDFLISHSEEVKNAIRKKADRDLILVSLLNSAFYFSFDVLKIFGKFFSVQDIINRETINKALSNIYGGNRSTANAIDSVVPMLIEAGLFTRAKIGVYQRTDNLPITSAIAKQVYVESFKTNNSNSVLQDYQLRDPYFLFVNE
jgi:hypothetical protein